MSRSDNAAEGGEEFGASSASQEVSAPAIGKVQTVMGLVTITRTNVIVGQPAVGDFVYKGDLIETGVGGLIAIAFVDGTEFQLRDDARLVLDEFNYGADTSSQSALLRVLKGMFRVVAGKLAATGRLTIDTPAAQIRGIAPGTGFFGILTFTVFSFGLIRELKAASSDVAFIDDVPIDYKFFKHGVYELVTKGDHPEVIIVDDPTKTIILRARGAGSFSVQEVANTPQQMAQLQQAYQSAQEIYMRGQQDPLIQQMMHRADAQPQSTGSSGSSTPFLADQFFSPASLIIISGSGPGGPGSGGGPGGSAPPPAGPNPNTPTQKATWQYPVDGNWSNPLLWSDAFAPFKWQDIEIGKPVTVTIDSSMGDSGPTVTAVNNLTLDTGATLDIVNGGLLTVYGALVVNSGATLKVNSTGVDPMLTLDGSVTVAAGGIIEALGAGTAIFFEADAVDNSGTIAAIDSGAAVSFEQATTTNEITGLIVANNSGAVTFDQGSVQSKGTIEAEANGTVTFNHTSIDNFGTIEANGGEVLFAPGTTVTNEVGGLIIAENSGIVILNAGNTITANDHGLLEASTSGELDVKDSGIYNAGNSPLAAVDPSGILLASGGTLLVDVGTLTLNGGGDVALTGGVITGSAVKAGDALVNIDNTIYGYGTISNLTLTNDFVIQAVGGTLTLDGVILDEDSTSATPAGIDVVSVLMLNDSTVIFGGGTDALTVESTGELQITAGTGLDGAIPGGATLDGVVVTDKNTSTIGIDVSGATLTLNDNTQIIGNGNGTLTVESDGQLVIAAGAASDSATAGGATLNGVIVTDSSTLGAGGIEVATLATLTLDGGTQIIGTGTDTLVIDSSGHLAINGPTGATLNGLVVDDDTATSGASSGINVSGSTLTLDGGTAIRGGGSGTLTVASNGELLVTSGGATLDAVQVTDANATKGIDVSGAVLTLNDGTLISGGTLAVESTAGSQLKITAGTGADGASKGGATLDDIKVTDSNATDGIDVASGAVLTLNDGTVISGGTMTIAGTLEIDSGNNEISNVTVTDVGTVSQPSQLIVSGGVLTLDHDSFSGGVIEITVDSGAELILNDTQIKDAILDTLPGSILIIPANSSIETINSTLSGNNIVESGASLTLIDEFVTGTIDDLGTLVIGKGATTFDGVSVDDDNAAFSPPGIDVVSGATLTLQNNTQIQGGGSGTLTVENTGQLLIKTATGATLDGMVVTDSNTSDGIDVAAGAVLTLNDGTVIAGGTMTVEGTAKLLIAAGAGTDSASAGGATLDDVIVTDSSALASGGIEVSGVAAATLTLKDGTQIKGGGTMTIETSGAQLLVSTGGATLDNLIVDDDIIGGAVGIDVVTTLTLKDGTQILGGGSGTMTIESGGELSVTTAAGATLDGLVVTDTNAGGTIPGIDVASGAVLTLNDGTQINGGGTGTLTIESTGELLIAAGSGQDAAALRGATLDGVIVTDKSGFLAGDVGGIEVSGATLTLKDGTQIKGGGTMTIETSGAQLLVSTGGATLDNLIVDDDIIGGAVGIDVVTTLTLKDGTQILGGGSGTMTIESGGQLSVTTAAGATLDGLVVTDTNAGGTIPGIDVASGAVLTLNDGTQINGGTMTVEGTAKLLITAGAGTDSASAGGATLDDVIVTDSSALASGGIEVSGVAAATLTLKDGTQINGAGSATLVIDSGGHLAISSAGGATLDNLIVDDDTGGAAIGIDVASGATLTLQNNTQIQGGGSATLTVENTGQLLIKTATGATLDGILVTDSNTSDGIDVAAGAVLTLNDGTQINGGGTGTLTIESTGELLIAAGSGQDAAALRGATLDGVIVTDKSGFLAGDVGGIEVSGATLTLKDGTQIKGGGTMTIETSGAQLLVSTGGATLDNLIVDDDIIGGAVGIDVVTTLTLKDGTQILGGGSGTMTIESGGELSVTTAAGATLDGLVVTDTNAGGTIPGIDVASGAVLTLNDGTQINGGGTGTLTIESTGELLIAAGSGQDAAALRGATLDGVIVTDKSGFLAGDVGGIEVSGATLTLKDGTQIKGGGTMTIETSGAQLLVSTGGATLDNLIVDDDIIGGAVGIDVVTTLTLKDGTQILGGGSGTMTIESGGQLSVTTAAGATLDGLVVTDTNAGGTIPGIDVASGAVLTLNDGTQINGGTMTVEGTAKLLITAGAGTDSASAGGATLDDVIVTDSSALASGGIEVSGVAAATLTLKDGTQINGAGSATLVIDSGGHLAISSAGGATLDNLIVDDDTGGAAIGIDVASGATLTLQNNTQIQGGGSATLTVENTGQLLIKTATGATLDGILVTDSNTSDGIDVAAGAVLTLNDGTQINGGGTGTLTIESTGELLIAAGSGQDAAALRGATLDGVIVTDKSGFLAGDVGGIEVSGATLTLKDGTQIKGGGTGTMTIESSSGSQLQISTATGATLDGVVVDDDNTGTGVNAGIYVASGVLTLDGGTQIQGGGTGTLTTASTGELKITGTGATLDGVIVTDSGMLEVAGTLELTGSGELRLVGGTVAGVLGTETLDNVDNTISGAGTISNLDLDNAAAGVINATGLLILNTGQAIENAGLLEATAGGTLQIDVNDTITNTGTLKATGGGELDVKTTTITDNSSATVEIDTGSELLVDNAHLTLNGDGTGKLTLAGTALITGNVASNELENVNNKISGAGTISNLTLVNDASATIDATGTLVLTTTNTITNAGLLEATATGELDVKDGEISNTGTIHIDAGAELLVDATALKLDGGGTGKLTLAGTITGNLASNELDNVDNTISGAGTISNLTLVNDASATIDATGTLVLTTTNTITNAGLLEATATGELDVKDGEISNTGTIHIDAGAELLVDATALKLDGGGTGKLTLTGTITGNLASNELDNVDNTISGAGTISNLDLDNAAAGVINATGLLILNTGQAIENAGLLEATAGGTLQIDVNDTITNTGTLKATGGGELDVKTTTITDNSSATVEIDTGSELLVDNAHLTLNGDGTGKLTLAGTALITGNVASNELENVNNKISGAGTISNLTLVNDASATIDATGTLVLTTTNTITNAGLLEATATGELDVKDGEISNTGTIHIDAGAELLVDATALKLDGGGTGKLTLAGTITGNLASNELDNVDNTISGAGTISNLDLDNAAAGVINATGLLILNTGQAIENAGLLEATAGGTLQIDVNDTITNTGTLKAINGGDLILDTAVVTNFVGAANGTVSVADNTSKLELQSATITGGIVTVDGLLDSTGTSFLTSAAITIASTGTLESTGGGTLTIDPSTINNSGTLEADGGALTITGVTTFTNTGLLLATADSTLTLSGDTVTNFVLATNGTVQVDAGSILDLAGTTITGGIVTVDGLLDSIGNSAIDDAAITIGASGALQIDANEKLTLSNVTIAGGTITDEGSVDVTEDCTFDNVSISNTGIVEVDIGKGPTTLTLENGASIDGSVLVIGASNAVDIEGSGATLSNISVVNFGSLAVDAASGPATTLTLDGAGIIGGTLSVGASGAVDVEGAGAVLERVTVSNSGNIQVGDESNPTTLYLLDGTKLSGGALTIGSDGVLDVEIGSHSSIDTLDGVKVTDNGSIEVGALASGATLVLDDGTTVSGGGTLTINSHSTLDVGSGTATLNISGTIANSGTLEVNLGATLDVACAISGGSAIIHGGVLEFDASSNVNVNFDNSHGYGELILGDAEDFHGQISGFFGTAADAAHSDVVELINFAETSYSVQSQSGNEILTLHDAHGHAETLTFDNFSGTLVVSSSGGKTFIYDPPASGAQVTAGGPIAVDGPKLLSSSTDHGLIGADHTILPPVTDAAGSASSFLSGASTNSDQGLSLDSDQNGLFAKTSVFGNDHAIIPPDNTSVLGGDQIIAPPDTTSGLGDHTVNSPIKTSVLGADHANVPTITEVAGNGSSLLSAGSTNSDQGLSLDSDQNGLSTTTSSQGSDHAIDPSGSGGVQTNVLVADTPALGDDHVIVPALNTPVLGGDQVIVPPDTTSGLGDHTVNSPIYTSVLGADHAIVPTVTEVAGNGSSLLSVASTNSDQGLSLDSDQNGLSTTTSSQGSDHALDLSGADGVQTNVLVADTPALGDDHAIVPTVTEVAGNGSSLLSAASTNSDQGLSLDSDQNGLSTTTSSQGSDHALDLSGTGGVQTNVLVADTPALGDDHVIVPALNTPVLGGDQVIVPPANPMGLGDHAVASPFDPSVLGGDHTILPPVTDAAGSASSLLSAASTNSDQGLSLDSDQNGLLAKTSVFGNDHAIIPPDNTSVLGGDQIIAPPDTTSGLGDHTVNSPINTSVLGADHAIVPTVTEVAGNGSSLLSAASTNSDQGLSLDSDQNGLSTTTSSQGSDHALDLSGTGGVQTNVLVADTPALGDDHVIVPALITPVLGGDQVIVPAAPTGLGDHAVASPIDPSVLGGDHAIVPPVTDAPDSASSFLSASTNSAQGLSLDSDQNGLSTTTSSQGSDHALDLSGTGGVQTNVLVADTPALGDDRVIVPMAMDPDAGTSTGSQAIEKGLTGGDLHTALSTLLNVLTGDHANAPSVDTTALGGDHAIVPAVNAPTLAAATFSGLGNDKFVFQTNLGTETNQNSDDHPTDFGHGNNQTGPQTFAPVAHDVAPEFAFDPGHLEVADLTKTAIDQFHQLVASVAHLH